MATLLNWDQSYISRVEKGHRRIRDTRELLRIASTLEIEPEQLGVSLTPQKGGRIGDPREILTSIRRARKLRTLGQPMQAHTELRNAANDLQIVSSAIPGDQSRLLQAELKLAQAWVLCELLPEEQLNQPAEYMMQAWKLVASSELDATSAYVLSTLGNHLRMAGRLEISVPILERALTYREEPEDTVGTAALLGRASGILRRTELFNQTIALARDTLEDCRESTALINDFSLCEIEARGLLQAGNVRRALKVITSKDGAGEMLANPQWRIIFAITQAEIMIASGATTDSLAVLDNATRAAAAIALPHQLQRIEKIARKAEMIDSRFHSVADTAASAIREHHLRSF